MVLDTLFVELSAILTEIHQKKGFFRNVGTNMHTKMPWTHAVDNFNIFLVTRKEYSNLTNKQ